MKVIIPGRPIPKLRARTLKKGWSYDPQQKEKERIRKYILQAVSQNLHQCYLNDLDCSYDVHWYFYMPIPKHFSKSLKKACIEGYMPHISKPDCTNLIKFYEDCANGILWSDDSRIILGSFSKKYDESPRTEIFVERKEKMF